MTGQPKYTGGRKPGSNNLELKYPEDMRRPGEDEVEWKKRYNRQCMARWRKQNKEKELARRREIYALNGPGDAKIAWKEANADKLKTYSKEHFERNREEKLTKLKEWVRANPERQREASRRWAAANADYVKLMSAANAAKYRGRTRDATPIWVDWRAIWRIYGQAKRISKKTGIPHQVDHIVPLNGKTVSGLHVPWNLRVITAAENRAKWCHLIEEDAIEDLRFPALPLLDNAA